MQTGQIVSNVVVGGIQFSSTVARSAEGQISHVVVLAAGKAGAISATGVDGLTTGHGIVGTNVVDVHWTHPADGVTHKCRRGLLVDSASANAIVFDETPAGDGDALPAEDTAVIVSVQVVIDTTWDGDLVELVAAKNTVRAVADFRSAAASLMALKQVAGEAWSWASGQGGANPLTGDPTTKIVLSNGAVTAGTFYCGVLYQSV